MAHLHTKFEVSSFNRSGDRRGVPTFKRGSRDPGHALFEGHFIFCRLVLVTTHLRVHTKFEVSSFIQSKDMEGSHMLPVKLTLRKRSMTS